MSRSKKWVTVRPPGSKTHSSVEWAFERSAKLVCPKVKSHILGSVRQDMTTMPPDRLGGNILATSPKTVVSSRRDALQVEGPPTDPARNLRWTCRQCDLAAAKAGDLTRAGRPLRHEGIISAATILQLLEALASNGPPKITVRLDPKALVTAARLVESGEQLADWQQAEAARVRRRRG